MLLSGNGRHRRPRQAPTAVVAVAATGAGIALPLLGAGGAQAADAATWDKVAACESGGMWSARTGNAFYGGLQITQETWETYGGTAYAARPDLASRSQQIAVAEKILADLGPGAWPACAETAGLTDDGGAPEVNPGTPPAATEPTDAQTSGTEAGADSGGAAPSASSDPPAGTATASPGPSQDGSGGGRHRKPAVPAEPAGPSAQPAASVPSVPPLSGTAGGDAASGSAGETPAAPADGNGGAEAAPGTVPEAGGGESAVESAVEYTVEAGDSLSAIAAEYGVAGGWPALYEANEAVVGDDHDLIHPGQLLRLD